MQWNNLDRGLVAAAIVASLVSLMVVADRQSTDQTITAPNNLTRNR